MSGTLLCKHGRSRRPQHPSAEKLEWCGNVHKQQSIPPPAIIFKLCCYPAVYGRENRLKVSRDEAKFEEENKLKRERHLQVVVAAVSTDYRSTLSADSAQRSLSFLVAPSKFVCRLSAKQDELLCFREQGRNRHVYLAHSPDHDLDCCCQTDSYPLCSSNALTVLYSAGR